MEVKQTKYPSYVNNEAASFKHGRSDLKLKFLSDWVAVEKLIHADTDTCPVYFPSSLELQYDKETEAQLAKDIQAWSFFDSLPPKLARLAINFSRFCSIRSELSYNRRVLLHHHTAWIFLMDDVTEKLPLYNLHKTAGRMYLDNLKNITTGGPIEDMMQFKGSCPNGMLEAALMAQRILAEDLMPLKRKLLSPQHLQACIDTLNQFFDFQYEEGDKFCTECSSQEILETRAITVGGLVPMLLSMGSTQAKLYALDDPGLIQLSVLMIHVNDIIGLYKDLEAVDQQDDGSAYLNLVRVGMREQGFCDKDALRLYAHKLNNLTRSFELSSSAFSSSRRDFYIEPLKLAFNYLDYHLMGIMGNPNNRYGWRQVNGI